MNKYIEYIILEIICLATLFGSFVFNSHIHDTLKFIATVAVFGGINLFLLLKSLKLIFVKKVSRQLSEVVKDYAGEAAFYLFAINVVVFAIAFKFCM